MNFRFKLTKAAALKIQAQQVEYYSKLYDLPCLKARVAALTRANLLLDDVEYDVVTVNYCIPRGGAIENLIPQHRANEESARARGKEARRLDRDAGPWRGRTPTDYR